jgi:hypothetical protein
VRTDGHVFHSSASALRYVGFKGTTGSFISGWDGTNPGS